jgi:hypothetical protein
MPLVPSALCATMNTAAEALQMPYAASEEKNWLQPRPDERHVRSSRIFKHRSSKLNPRLHPSALAIIGSPKNTIPGSICEGCEERGRQFVRLCFLNQRLIHHYLPKTVLWPGFGRCRRWASETRTAPASDTMYFLISLTPERFRSTRHASTPPPSCRRYAAP